MKKTLILSILLLSSLIGYSQIVNSNKTTLAQFYNADVNRVELNGAKISTQFRLKKWKTPYVYKNHPEIKSAEKNNAVFFNLGATNTSSFLNLNKLDLKENNGYTLGIEFQHSFSEVYLSRDSINTNPFKLKSFFISLDYTRDKFNNFDPTSNSISKAKPDNLTLSSGYSLYIFNYKDNAKFKYSIVPTINAYANLIGYNESGLKNYILNSNTQSVQNIQFKGSKSFDGKYGTIDNSIQSFEISISSPLIPENRLFKGVPIISPIPYVSYKVIENSKPRLNGGFALSFLSKSLLDKERKQKGNSTYRKFNVPSFLMIGVDWNYQDGKGSSPNYFISVSIKL